jgi:hypothetical protein
MGVINRTVKDLDTLGDYWNYHDVVSIGHGSCDFCFKDADLFLEIDEHAEMYEICIECKCELQRGTSKQML